MAFEGQEGQGQEVEVRTPDPTSIDAAVAQLLKEPEEAPQEAETEETAEQSETEETTETEETEESEEGEAPQESEEEPEETETESESEQLDYYLIKVDGEEIEVTLDELRSGYQRQKDYTKKTQSLSEQRKEYDSKASELEKLQSDFMNQATLANELLNRDLKKFEKVDWETLKTDDPVAYVQKQIEVQELRTQQQELQAQAQRVYEHNQQVQADEAKQYLETQRKEALTLFPEWKDTSMAEKQQLQLVEYARNIGYSDSQLAGITNAKDLLVLDKARKFDELEAKKGSIAKKKTQPAVRKVTKSKGKAPAGTSRKKSIQDKSTRLRKTGSLKDAAALMYEMQQNKAINK